MSTAQKIFDRQLPATWPNPASGTLAVDCLVDSDGDTGYDASVSEVLSTVGAARLKAAIFNAVPQARTNLHRQKNVRTL